MSYEVIAVDEFQRDVKKLYKKYKSIKSDLLELISKLEEDHAIGIDSLVSKLQLGNALLDSKTSLKFKIPI